MRLPVKDLHSEPFDEGTCTKLQIFEKYAKEWIPVFVMSGHRELWIFDFFAGPGYDINGVPGTPVRLLTQAKNFLPILLTKQGTIHFCFNEYKNDKFQKLKENCEEFISSNKLPDKNVKVEYDNKDFDDIFSEKTETIKNYPSLVYLDQNGVKFFRKNILSTLITSPETDFLYFISTSYINRFGDTAEFRNSLPFEADKLKKNPYKYIHQTFIEELRKMLPQESKTKFYPFSIKKGTNIYGIIFGAKHPRAVDKFLSIAWNLNEINGCANYDIDDDNIKRIQGDLFEGHQLSRIEKFRTTLT